MDLELDINNRHKVDIQVDIKTDIESKHKSKYFCCILRIVMRDVDFNKSNMLHVIWCFKEIVYPSTIRMRKCAPACLLPFFFCFVIIFGEKKIFFLQQSHLNVIISGLGRHLSLHVSPQVHCAKKKIMFVSQFSGVAGPGRGGSALIIASLFCHQTKKKNKNLGKSC